MNLQTFTDGYVVEIKAATIISKKNGKPRPVRYAEIRLKATNEIAHTTQNCPDRHVALSKARRWLLNQYRDKFGGTDDGQS